MKTQEQKRYEYLNQQYTNLRRDFTSFKKMIETFMTTSCDNQIKQKTSAGIAVARGFADGNFSGIRIEISTPAGSCEVSLDVTPDGEIRCFCYKIGEDEPSETVILN